MWSSHQERTNTPISKSVMTIVCKDSHKMMNHAQKSMSIVIYLVAMIQMISANKLVKKKRCNMRYQCARNHVNRKWKVLSLPVEKVDMLRFGGDILHYAVSEGKKDIVDLVIRKGADVMNPPDRIANDESYRKSPFAIQAVGSGDSQTLGAILK